MEEKNINEIEVKNVPAAEDKILGVDSVTGEAVLIELANVIGEKGDGIQVQYAATVGEWHFPYASSDIYMRHRIGAGNWSSPIKLGLSDFEKNEMKISVTDDVIKLMSETIAIASAADLDSIINVGSYTLTNSSGSSIFINTLGEKIEVGKTFPEKDLIVTLVVEGNSPVRQTLCYNNFINNTHLKIVRCKLSSWSYWYKESDFLL